MGKENIEPFDLYPGRYDEWFDRNRGAYEAELSAVRRLMPKGGRSLEVGSGSARFALPLGVSIGIDPSEGLNRIALSRGLRVVRGVAENLPFGNSTFDCVLMATVLCFLKDVQRALEEARRVIKPEGSIIVAFIDRESLLGREYERRKDESPFYRNARFYSAGEVIGALKASGFDGISAVQTLFRNPEEVKYPEPVKEGHGEGSFVVVRGIKKP